MKISEKLAELLERKNVSGEEELKKVKIKLNVDLLIPFIRIGEKKVEFSYAKDTEEKIAKAIYEALAVKIPEMNKKFKGVRLSNGPELPTMFDVE